jgi:hypothetical protein
MEAAFAGRSAPGEFRGYAWSKMGGRREQTKCMNRNRAECPFKTVPPKPGKLLKIKELNLGFSASQTWENTKHKPLT